MSLRRALRWSLPVGVSTAILAFLLARFDLAAVAAQLTGRRVGFLAPALLVYGAVSLWIEAVTLRRLVVPEGRPLPLGIAARMKAATYLLNLLHYALGAVGLATLLRRRVALPLAEASGVVLLVSVLDLAVVVSLAALGGLLVATRQPLAVQGGLVAGLVGGGLIGLVWIRRGGLGLLERLRAHPLLRVVRETPLRVLSEVAVLRVLFAAVFVVTAGAALASFGIRVPVAELVAGLAMAALVAALPIAVAGLGTSQAAFVVLFRRWADPQVVLAASLALSAGIILVRAGLGLAFAHEFTREALRARGEQEA